MAEDPFLQVQADVLSLLQTTRPLFSSYLRIRSSTTSSSSPELAEARHELESNLTDLKTDLQDLIDSVKAVEQDPFAYGLDIDEVSRRRKLVNDVSSEIEDMHQQLNQTVSNANARTPLAHPDSFGVSNDDDEDADYEAWQEQRQMEIMHEQDEALEGVFQTVGNLRQQADTMGRELEEQADMLEDVDNTMERVSGKLQQGIKKINLVIRKNEGLWLLETRFCSMLTRDRQILELLHHGTHIPAHPPADYSAFDMKQRCAKSSCDLVAVIQRTATPHQPQYSIMN